jgi:hypothetical protein
MWTQIPIVNNSSLCLYEKDNLAVLIRFYNIYINYSLLRDHKVVSRADAVYKKGIVDKILKDWENNITYIQLRL